VLFSLYYYRGAKARVSAEGRRLGRWLAWEEARTLLQAPNPHSMGFGYRLHIYPFAIRNNVTMICDEQ